MIPTKKQKEKLETAEFELKIARDRLKEAQHQEDLCFKHLQECFEEVDFFNWESNGE